MNRRINFAAVLCWLALAAGAHSNAQQAHPVSSLAAVTEISNAEAAAGEPVAFEGIVTYYRHGNVDLFVQDGNAAIYVETANNLNLNTGDRVLVEGNIRASFHPEVKSSRVTFLHHGEPPAPIDANFAQLIRAEFDCKRVTVRAIVRAANFVTDGDDRIVVLDLLIPGGHVEAQIASGGGPSNIKDLLDAEVQLTGAAAGKFDSKSQMIGVLLEVPYYSDLKILKAAEPALRASPLRQLDDVLPAYSVDDKTQRVRVEGTITYFQRGSALVLQDGDKALWVDTQTEDPHQVGERAIVSGFPDVRNGSVVLTRAVVESSAVSSPALPQHLTPPQLTRGMHAYELISVDGQLLMQVREAAQDEYVIVSQGHLFSAIYRHPERNLNLPLPAMNVVRIGSRVRMTGICVLDRNEQVVGPVGFHILVRSPDEVAVLAGPSIVSVRNLVVLLALVLIATFVFVGRTLILERRLRAETAAAASSTERWRNRVIDGINNAIPLEDTLLQIAELLAFKLHLKYCWVEIAGAGVFGNCPGREQLAELRVVEYVIPSRFGEPLGRICVGLESRSGDQQFGAQAMENSTRLAALAIETGGKYSDLVRRSELDPLTKAYNRFAFERDLDIAIEQANNISSRLGLIYIDLDRFKQVNDQFGHRMGDQYLQEAARRIQHLLRPSDMLARLGGDEFVVLIATVESQNELDEIAGRLQHSFDNPFSLDQCEVRGYVSVGVSMFPDDGTTRATLLECADIRMYAAKRSKRLAPASASPDADEVGQRGRFGT
jgi:diguanylate cyclase (GGDEF)-like protein